MNYFNTAASYLRVPFLASSGLAALSSSLLYFKQNSLIYPSSILNSRVDVPPPSQFNIRDAESLHIPTPDGETLHAYYLRPPNARVQKNVTILAFHGNAGNVGHRLPIGKVFSESLGCHVFMLEYRGYGKSTGTPDEAGLTVDAQTALDYIRTHSEMQRTKIVIYGQSLGGAVAVKLLANNLEKTAQDDRSEKQKDTRIAGVILENTFLSIRKLIPTVIPPARYISFLCHQRWPSEDLVQALPQDGPPILFLSGLQDEIVPPSMMRTLYDLCKVDRRTWRTFENGDHNSTVSEPGYFDSIWDWLSEEVLKEEEKQKGTGYTDVKEDDLRVPP
ncbi:bem46 protein, variant [Lithohypha guttulata]|uniref:Bem46 protein, variant n=1 Tax=Lithohypha guttulata TaxID=1690604 RepID=A0AAN7T4U4_9EURO|nr:bem46 protein, variant [Lithohypha guttulata]KAK5090478.1 bem46 protein, variant [Lithohypha guttulata]KAK5104728.1 bem46 protein, variant [Lithohypha guttulata]